MDELRQIDEKHYELISASGNTYRLTYNNTGIKCSCLGFKHRQKCRHTDFIQVEPKKRYPASYATKVLAILKGNLGNNKHEIAGSYRRGKSTIGDVDILVEATEEDFFGIRNSIDVNPNVQTIVVSGNDICRGTVIIDEDEIQFDITRVNANEWASYLLYRTGPRDFNIKMRAEAKRQGMKLNEHGLYTGELFDMKFETPTEADICYILGLSYIAPEFRI